MALNIPPELLALLSPGGGGMAPPAPGGAPPAPSGGMQLDPNMMAQALQAFMGPIAQAAQPSGPRLAMRGMDIPPSAGLVSEPELDADRSEYSDLDLPDMPKGPAGPTTDELMAARDAAYDPAVRPMYPWSPGMYGPVQEQYKDVPQQGPRVEGYEPPDESVPETPYDDDEEDEPYPDDEGAEGELPYAPLGKGYPGPDDPDFEENIGADERMLTQVAQMMGGDTATDESPEVPEESVPETVQYNEDDIDDIGEFVADDDREAIINWIDKYGVDEFEKKTGKSAESYMDEIS